MKSSSSVPINGAKINADIKFGRNEDVDAQAYMNPWGLVPKELAVGSAVAIYISSTHSGDTDVIITIEYLDDEGLPQTVSKALDDSDSKTFVDTGVIGIFVNRAYVDDGAITLNGDIYISADNTDSGGDGIPDTLSNTFAQIPLADNQTMQAQFLVPVGFEIRVYGWRGSFIHDGGAATNVTYRLKQLPSGGSWRTIESDGARSSANQHAGEIWPFSMNYPALTQIALEVQEVSATNNDVAGQFYYSLHAV